MARPPNPYPRQQIRAQVRKSVNKAVLAELAKENIFNPSKPEQGAFSRVVEDLLVSWLKDRLSEEEFMKVMSDKT